MALALSPEEIHQIAVGCFYILMRRGTIDFPDSTRAHPSPKVVVNRATGDALRGGDDAYLPFSVPWDVWQFGVVPVLKDKTYQVFCPDGTRNQGNLALIRLRDYDQYIALIVGGLTAKLQEIGYIPAEPVEEPIGDSDLEGDGDPIMRVGSIGDSGFPIVDAEAGDLIYPIVED